jgi:hypothetical protein
MVTLIGDVIGTDHVCYCWFRKWTQMLMLFVRRSLVSFITGNYYGYLHKDYDQTFEIVFVVNIPKLKFAPLMNVIRCS